MKPVLCVGFLLMAIAAFGGTSTNGGPASSQSAEIVWSAPTNRWPEKLWSYAVVPQDFSPAAISNLLAVASLSWNDRTKISGDPPFKDKSILLFRSADQSKRLAICPTLGMIDYRDDKAESPSRLQPVVGVPSDEEATRLGLGYLRLLDIDISEIAVKPGTDNLDLHWERGTIKYFDKNTEQAVVLTNRCGVLFLRRIDGVNVRGFGRGGGVTVCFGNNAKVSDLRVCWRNLKHDRLRDCPTPAQVTAWIAEGKIRLHPMGSEAIYPTQGMRRLTIMKATPRYDGAYYDEPMRSVFPYAEFEGTAENEHGTATVWFQSPMTLASENWRIVQ